MVSIERSCLESQGCGERPCLRGKKKKEKNENQGRLEQSCVTAHTCSLSPDQSFPVRELLSPKEGNGFFGEKNG